MTQGFLYHLHDASIEQTLPLFYCHPFISAWLLTFCILVNVSLPVAIATFCQRFAASWHANEPLYGSFERSFLF